MMFFDVQQNTEEWLEMRKGVVTSSSMACIMAHYGKDFGDPAKKLAEQIALERFNNKRIEKNSYTSEAMTRGHELEPIARELYELETLQEVKNGGFFTDGRRGDSPDGLIGEDGVLEIKCVEFSSHFKVLKKGGYDTSYKWQIHNHIWTSNRKWCDFVSFCPDFPEEKQIYIFRVERDEEIIKQMKERYEQFEDLILQNLKLLKS